jgi:hypothetical protein
VIDPKMINPDRVAPTTDIVTPTPQYYGQGQVRGGNIQLGDVAGRRPSKTSEQQMFEALSQAADTALKFGEAPEQIRQKQRQLQIQQDEDNRKKDQALLDAFREQDALLMAASQKELGTFEYGGQTYDNLSDPKKLSEIREEVAADMLDGMLTDLGSAKRNEIVLDIYKTRDQSYDDSVQSLLTAHKARVLEIQESNPFMDATQISHKIETDEKLRSIEKKMQLVGDNASTQIREDALFQVRKAHLGTTQAAVDHQRELVGDQVIGSVAGLVEVLEDPALQGPIVAQMIGEDPTNGEDLLTKMFPEGFDEDYLKNIGVVQTPDGRYHSVSGGVYDTFMQRGDRDSLKAMYVQYVKYQLQKHNPSLDPVTATNQAVSMISKPQVLNKIADISNKITVARDGRELRQQQLGAEVARETDISNPVENNTVRGLSFDSAQAQFLPQPPAGSRGQSLQEYYRNNASGYIVEGLTQQWSLDDPTKGLQWIQTRSTEAGMVLYGRDDRAIDVNGSLW